MMPTDARIRQVLVVLFAAVVVAIFVASLVNAVVGALYWYDALRFPYSIDYGEGGILASVVDIRAGDPIYPPFGKPPFTMQNYPPLFMLVAAGLTSVIPAPPLEIGRGLSMVSALCCTLLVGMIAWRVAEAVAQRAVRLFAALFAGVGFLGAAPVLLWSPLMRVDLLGMALALLGLWLFVSSRWRAPWIVAACAAMVLAGFTKPTIVSALIACCGVALVVRPRTGLAMGAGCAAAVAAGLFGLNTLSRGHFFGHVVFGNVADAWGWHKLRSIVGPYVSAYPASLVLAAGGLVATVGGRPRGTSLAPARAAVPGAAVCAVYFALSALITLTAGKGGAGMNYLLELASATGLMGAVALARLWTLTTSRESLSRGFLLATGAFAAALVAATVAQVIATPSVVGSIELKRAAIAAPDETYADWRDIVTEIRNTPGDVLTEDRLMAVLAGKRVYFEFHDGSLLIEAGKIKPAPILGKIKQRAFPLIVVSRNTGAAIAGTARRGKTGRLLKPFRRAIAANYDAEVRDHFVVYRPKPE